MISATAARRGLRVLQRPQRLPREPASTTVGARMMIIRPDFSFNTTYDAMGDPSDHTVVWINGLECCQTASLTHCNEI
jgi:hypothetical protein